MAIRLSGYALRKIRQMNQEMDGITFLRAVSDVTGSDAEGASDLQASLHADRQRLIYIADLALELHRLSERSGCRTLAGLFRLAHLEALLKAQEWVAARATRP